MVSTFSPPSRPPWPYDIAIPQRFSVKYERYQELGGLIDVAGDARAYAGEEPLQDVERLMFLNLAFDQIHKEGLQGNFAELGVYQGSTATLLARNARRLNRQLFLLDTYEGFNAQDFSGLDAGRGALFADTSLEVVRMRVGEANTIYIKGYFPQTIEQLPDDGQYCLVHIDTDLYAPIMSGLEYFYPRMVPGGFLIVHDYGSLAWDGAEKAVDSFFADKPESVIQIPDSCGSAVIRRLRRPDAGPSWITQRQSLEVDVWHSAGNGQLSNLLTDGWSSPEPWGTWGVGPSHQIKLMTDTPTGQHIAVDLDVHAFVSDKSTGRQAEVFVNDQPAATLTFTEEQDHLTLSLEPLTAAADGSLTIEFRPLTVVVPKDVIPTSDDTRALGVALSRIRVRLVDGS